MATNSDCNPKRLQEFESCDPNDTSGCGCSINDIKWSGSVSCFGITSGNSLATVIGNIMSRVVIDRSTIATKECDTCGTVWIDMEDGGVIQGCGENTQGEGRGIEWVEEEDHLRIFSDEGAVIIEDYLFLNGGLQIMDGEDLIDATPLSVNPERLYYPIDATNGDILVTLTEGVYGQVYIFNRIDSTAANTVTINPFGSEIIQGISEYNLKPGESIMIVFTKVHQGDAWRIVSRHWVGTGSENTTSGSATLVDKRLIGLSSFNFILIVDGSVLHAGVDFTFVSATGTITYTPVPASGLNQKLVIL